MAAKIGVRATFFATGVLLLSALTIEETHGKPSKVRQSEVKGDAAAAQTEAVTNTESAEAASSRDALDGANGAGRVEPEPTKAGESSEEKPPCVVCGKTVPAESMAELEKAAVAKQVRLTAELLREKLRLQPLDADAPNDTADLGLAKSALENLPKALLEGDQDDEEMEDVDVWEKMKIFPGEEGADECMDMRSCKCYNFLFEEEFRTEVVAAHLWLHQSICGNDVIGQTVLVSEVNRSGLTPTLARAPTLPGEDWLKINLTQPVVSWAKANQESVSLAFRCGHKNDWSGAEAQSTHKPYLSVEFARERRQRRVKRSASGSCNRDTQCCKVNLSIRGTDMGLPEILSNVTTNYCFGSCLGTLIGKVTSNHTMFRTKWIEHSTMEHAANQLKSCCVPTRLGPGNITLLENGDTVVKTMSNMVALECGCV